VRGLARRGRAGLPVERPEAHRLNIRRAEALRAAESQDRVELTVRGAIAVRGRATVLTGGRRGPRPGGPWRPGPGTLAVRVWPRGGHAPVERPVAVEVEPDAQERRALLERVRGGSLQVVAERDERAAPLLARDLAHAELHLRDAVGGEPAEHEHLVLPDLVVRDLEGPRPVQRLVQAMDHVVALDVVEDAVAPLALPDLRGLERLLQQCAVHRTPPPTC